MRVRIVRLSRDLRDEDLVLSEGWTLHSVLVIGVATYAVITKEGS